MEQQTIFTASENIYEKISQGAGACGLAFSGAELATLTEEQGFGEGELNALDYVFSYLAQKRHDAAIETNLRLSRLPRHEPKTFENFDFNRIQGKDCDALKNLAMLSEIHARKNILLIGPGGVGKTHLAQAYGYACCMAGYKTYFIKATELQDKFSKVDSNEAAARCVANLVKPTCLIIDEMGRCDFDEDCTNLFFDVIDRRYEKEGPNTLIITSNTQPALWEPRFAGKEALLCALDRVFDRAAIYMIDGDSFRGASRTTFSVKAAPTVSKSYGIVGLNTKASVTS